MFLVLLLSCFFTLVGQTWRSLLDKRDFLRLLASNLVYSKGCQQDPNEDQDPDPAFENIVIMEQPAPGVLHEKVPETELEGDSEDEPDQADCQCLS